MQIVPTNHFTLKQVFQKTGYAVFGDIWNDNIINFIDDVKPLIYGIIKLDGKDARIYPINFSSIMEHVEGFTYGPYYMSDIEKLSKQIFILHEQYMQVSKAKEIDKLGITALDNKRVASVKNIKTKVPTESDYLLIFSDKFVKERIKQGIMYCHIAKGILQLLVSKDNLVGTIIDSETGKRVRLPIEYWLASKSKYSFSSGEGKYNRNSSLNVGKYSQVRSYKYEGVIIFEEEPINEIIKDYAKAKSQTPSPVGRKSVISWKRFNSEAMTRLAGSYENLPKQDAFAEDMKAWCSRELGKDVGVSTIKERLKPIYDLLKE